MYALCEIQVIDPLIDWLLAASPWKANPITQRLSEMGPSVALDIHNRSAGSLVQPTEILCWLARNRRSRLQQPLALSFQIDDISLDLFDRNNIIALQLHGNHAHSLMFLSTLSCLQSLSLSFSELPDLSALPQLSHLSLHSDETLPDSLEFLSRFGGLKKLSFEYSGEGADDDDDGIFPVGYFDPIRGCTGLTSLTLSSHFDEEDLLGLGDSLECLTGLQELTLSDESSSGNDFLERLTSLHTSLTSLIISSTLSPSLWSSFVNIRSIYHSGQLDPTWVMDYLESVGEGPQHAVEEIIIREDEQHLCGDTFKGLQQLTALTYLELPVSNVPGWSADDLEPLRAWTNLRGLKLEFKEVAGHQAQEGASLRLVNYLPINLRELTLCSIGSQDLLEVDLRLPKLTHLDLTIGDPVSHASFGQRFTRLRQLHLTCNMVSSVANVIHSLKSLVPPRLFKLDIYFATPPPCRKDDDVQSLKTCLAELSAPIEVVRIHGATGTGSYHFVKNDYS